MTASTPHPLLRYGPAVVMTLLIPVLSLLPAHFFAPVPTPLPPLPGMDKLIHAMLYAALTAAYLHALAPACRSNFSAFLVIAAAATLYGVAMEICQSLFTDSRALDPLDALANLSGALAASLFSYAACRYGKRKKETRIASV